MAEPNDQGRTQPEFALGERMAFVEKALEKDEEHSKERALWQKELLDEKIARVTSEANVKDTAQKEAISKAEKAAGEAATALATELRTSRETSDTRLGALERGGASGAGEKLGGRAFALGMAAIAGPLVIAIVYAVVKAVGG